MQSLLKTPYGLLLFVLMLAGIEFFIWQKQRQKEMKAVHPVQEKV